ncbi:cAMP-binding domain of CRP or a regulatory subunit of cAMP-dependent protein kinases [Poseidonocella pacifica]|uniref:cAMP-binding domain of CRP or a regulatory subunit of cAMP-dependent protein kinases n=1 Tax=Poseidonocella pacifica TaxID=871651 RepID=A0A1I0X6N8_9RHOB|nr:Crp/Fnr family transcriptional regulator [Poseidonocella pacifica]SFA96030.1 cAMP-binding domain of CRP or a regulatory subunit of cAMP-dependent protein kinases [Poseidonocella pacifica]
MTEALTNRLVHLLEARDTLSPEERAALHALPARREEFRPGAVIIAAGRTPPESCLIVGGMAKRVQRPLAGTSIVSALHIPGDLVDLHGFVLGDLDHSVVAQGRCTVHFYTTQDLRTLTEEFPHLTRLLWMTTLIDAKINRMWFTANAGLRAVERIGHLFCELETRLRLAGLIFGNSFTLPLDQADLASILGLSRVHINRSVQDLRARGLLEWSEGRVKLPDLPRLRELSHFDPAYLEIMRIPR